MVLEKSITVPNAWKGVCVSNIAVKQSLNDTNYKLLPRLSTTPNSERKHLPKTQSHQQKKLNLLAKEQKQQTGAKIDEPNLKIRL